MMVHQFMKEKDKKQIRSTDNGWESGERWKREWENVLIIEMDETMYYGNKE